MNYASGTHDNEKKNAFRTIKSVSQYLLEKTLRLHSTLYGLATENVLCLFTEARSKQKLGIKVTYVKH